MPGQIPRFAFSLFPTYRWCVLWSFHVWCIQATKYHFFRCALPTEKSQVTDRKGPLSMNLSTGWNCQLSSHLLLPKIYYLVANLGGVHCGCARISMLGMSVQLHCRLWLRESVVLFCAAFRLSFWGLRRGKSRGLLWRWTGLGCKSRWSRRRFLGGLVCAVVCILLWLSEDLWGFPACQLQTITHFYPWPTTQHQYFSSQVPWSQYIALNTYVEACRSPLL